MSVDKFGRWSGDLIESVGGYAGAGKIQGLPGVGFKLNTAGNYDMSGKRLVNVGRGRNPREVVVVDQLMNLDKQCLKLDATGNEFDSRGKPITNLPEPNTDEDIVKLGYLKRSCLIMKEGEKDKVIFDVKRGKLTNLEQVPTDPFDVVNKKYVDENFPTMDGDSWDFKSKRIENLNEPNFATDGATKFYVDTKIVNSQQTNVEYTNEKTNFFYEDINIVNISKKRLANVADPISQSDAATVNYIVRLLSKMFYQFYSMLTPNSAGFLHQMTIPGARENWIDQNIIQPFFIDHENVGKDV
ncbi:hypothetical protein GE061_007739 [Apolygus lucorum]|uniref:Uncharacterized protein n=1 Tax=Apolygus lucorum TaxID=248454 RepID=A0A8S9WP37_APOLU|nr:hypothetical protein GE061_007739 [Apolygus lucorum]